MKTDEHRSNAETTFEFICVHRYFICGNIPDFLGAMHMLSLNRWTMVLAIFCLGSALLADAPATQPGNGLAPDDFDFKALLGGPPAAGSADEKAEIDRLLKLQKDRTPDEIQRCKDEVEVQPFAFSVIVGDWFSAANLPETNKLLKVATKKAKPIFGAAKAVWNRPRPFTVSDQIRPCVEEEKSASFPSGHATRGIVWATIIAQLVPEDKEAVMAYGREIGNDRALAGMHFPSDVIAGQTLGREIARRLLADPDFQSQLEKAKAECAAHASKAPAPAK
jgi:acid phosphatase (class A)